VRPEQVVEATLFASQTPLTASEIARADERLDKDQVLEAIQRLRDSYEERENAFQIYQLGDGFQILTRPEYAPYLERFDSVARSPHLSPAALETLAIIAYRQPIGRVEIEEVRGVGANSVLRTLLDWELVEVVGRGEGLGRPLLYGVSQRFLEHFGLKDLDDLPSPDELPVILGALQEGLEAADEPGEPEPSAEGAAGEAGSAQEAPDPAPASVVGREADSPEPPPLD
jgi:segregation and condensation protein B